MLHPGGIGRKTGIVLQPFQADGAAQAVKLRIIGDGDDHRAVRGGKHLIRGEIGMPIAHALPRLAGQQGGGGLVGHGRDLAIEQGNVDMLALATAPRMP